MRELEDLMADLQDLSLPRDLDAAAEKVKCPLVPGQRIYWYTKVDQEFCEEHTDDDSPRDDPAYSGIIVPAPDTEMRGGELEWEHCVVVQDQYPAVGEYHQAMYLAFPRLLDDENLVEVYSENKTDDR